MSALPCTPLRAELLATNQAIIQTVEAQFEPLRLDQLNWKPEPQKWSILQCFEHLNLTNDPYLHYGARSIARALNNPGRINPTYRPGLIGQWMLNTFGLPPDQRIRKVKKAPGYLSPQQDSSRLDFQVLTRFLDNQRRLIDLLEVSNRVDWTRTRFRGCAGRWVHFRLGDAVRIMTSHNQRHLLQAQRLTELPGFPK